VQEAQSNFPAHFLEFSWRMNGRQAVLTRGLRRRQLGNTLAT
jgi:hypothetical protein